MRLPSSWKVLEEESRRGYFLQLSAFLDSERTTGDVFPEEHQVFAALEATPYHDVGVLILGQDPYHGAGQAHGLCFSVQPGVPIPPSLRNIFKELSADVGLPDPTHGCLASWASQGVLLLNTVLTVRKNQPHSHRGQGWEQLTDAIIRKVSEKTDPVVFVLWGKPAQAKKKLIDLERHVLIESPHPSPLSAHRGFFGSRPFSRINKSLRAAGRPGIDWRIPRQ